MDESEREFLLSVGWTPELLAMLKPTPATEAVDRMFLERAHKALAAENCTALEFASSNPNLSLIELAQKLNHGVSAIGLVMAIYEDAEGKNLMRETVKDLLYRTIRDEFSEGWSTNEKVSPSVKIGGWIHEIKRFVRDPSVAFLAENIFSDLVFRAPPPEGWIPVPGADPLIERLFDRHWPAPHKNGKNG